MVSDKESDFKFIESGTYIKGQDKYAEEVFTQMEAGENIKEGEIIELPSLNALVLVNDKITGRTKPLAEIKGMVISEYQTEIEKQWIEKLKRKYPVKINENVFERVKKEIK